MKNQMMMLLMLGSILFVFTPSAEAQWSTSGSDIYYNLGNVGIGTTNPTSPLEVSGAQASNTFIRVSTTESGEVARLGDPGGANDGILQLFNSSGTENVRIRASANNNWLAANGGNVGIGTTNPAELLTVAGTAKAEEVIVTENVGADFVFEEDYHLPDLLELEAFLKANKHLPEVPTAKEMIRDGVKMGELQMKLLQKVEELTLYVIELEKRDRARVRQIEELTQRKASSINLKD